MSTFSVCKVQSGDASSDIRSLKSILLLITLRCKSGVSMSSPERHKIDSHGWNMNKKLDI